MLRGKRLGLLGLLLALVVLAGCASSGTTHRVGSLKDAIRDAKVTRSTYQLQRRALVADGAPSPEIVAVEGKIDEVSTNIEFLEDELQVALGEAAGERAENLELYQTIFSGIVGTLATLGLGKPS